jgi:hypothetical protein
MKNVEGKSINDDTSNDLGRDQLDNPRQCQNGMTNFDQSRDDHLSGTLPKLLFARCKTCPVPFMHRLHMNQENTPMGDCGPISMVRS